MSQQPTSDEALEARDRRAFSASLLSLGLFGPAVTASAQALPSSSRGVAPVSRPKRLAVVLGGGSARGFAHIGVIKALEAAGIKPDLIVGCSAGALVGAFWAGGYTGKEMETLAYEVEDNTIIDLVSGTGNSRRGLVSGQSLENFVNMGLRGRAMKNLNVPLVTVATQFPGGQLYAFDSGDVGFAVRASCSIPGIFLPAVRDNQEFLDGGLVSPIPVQTARSYGATLVVAVDVGAEDPNMARQKSGGGLYELILRSFEIMGQSLRNHEAGLANVLIRPDVGRISSTDFKSRKILIESGQRAGQRLAPVILSKLRGG